MVTATYLGKDGMVRTIIVKQIQEGVRGMSASNYQGHH